MRRAASLESRINPYDMILLETEVSFCYFKLHIWSCFSPQHNPTHPDSNYEIDTRHALMPFNRSLNMAEIWSNENSRAGQGEEELYSCT